MPARTTCSRRAIENSTGKAGPRNASGVHVEIFDLGGPRPGKHPLHARAERPARSRVAEFPADGIAKSLAQIRFDGGESRTAGAVQQDGAIRPSETAAHGRVPRLRLGYPECAHAAKVVA